MWFKVIDMIEKLEKEIISIDSEIGLLDSRIDTLECYKRNTSELQELINKSNSLEDRKRELISQQDAYIQMITEMPYSLREIQEHIDSLRKNKEALESEIAKVKKNSDDYLNMTAEMNCVNRGLRFFERKLEEINKRTNRR